MSGTAAQNWRELRRVYKLRVVCVPTSRPLIRRQWPGHYATIPGAVRPMEPGRPVRETGLLEVRVGDIKNQVSLRSAPRESAPSNLTARIFAPGTAEPLLV